MCTILYMRQNASHPIKRGSLIARQNLTVDVEKRPLRPTYLSLVCANHKWNLLGAAECAALAGLQATVAQQRVRHSFLSFKAPSLHSLRDLKTPSLHWLGVNTFRKGHQRLPWLRDSRVSTAYSLYLLLRGHDAHASPSPFSMW